MEAVSPNSLDVHPVVRDTSWLLAKPSGRAGRTPEGTSLMARQLRVKAAWVDRVRRKRRTFVLCTIYARVPGIIGIAGKGSLCGCRLQ